MTFAANDANKFTENLTQAYEQVNAATSAYVNAATKSSTAAWQGIEEMTRDMGGTMQESYARAVSAIKSIMSAKTPQEAAETQAEFMKDCFDGMIANSSKLAEMSMRLAKNTFDPLSQHANDTMTTVMKKAKVG